MSYQIYNDTATLKIVENGATRNLAKAICGVRDFGDYIVFSYNGDNDYLKILYSDVTVPSSASATALRNTINGYLTQTISTTIDTTGLATSAKQQQMIALLQQLVNCSCNTQPCGSNGYVQTILLA